MSELPKTYDPKAVEDKLYSFWNDSGFFHAEVNPKKKPYTIVIPPPNVTGQLHMGHAFDETLQDILIRTKRMQGYEALWMPGTDHAGIATQIKVEENLRKEEGKTRKWGGKIPPNLKLPLRDGDIDRPDDENYQEHFFVNASSKDAPQVVDRHVQPVTDPMMVYSGCYCNVSVNFYAFNANGNRGVAAGLGNVQFVKDGDRLSGKASAESDFDALDDEDVLGGDAGEELPDYLR